MDVARARWLTSPEGLAALASLDPSLEALTPTALADRLRKRFPPSEASALAEQLTLRAKARERFGDDFGFLYSPAGLEMMTHPAVAEHRALRLAQLGLPIVDLTCGIGGDLRACLQAGIPTTGLELDEATALLAAHNVPGAAILRGDAAHPPLDLSGVAVIIDPARRSAAGRHFDPSAFEPPWDTCITLITSAGAGVLKAPPGIDHRHIPPAAETEFIQVARSLREAAIWVGQGATPGLTRAILFPANGSLDSTSPEAAPEPAPIGRYLIDPESCVTRAGLVRHLAYVMNAALIDPQMAYLTADGPGIHPLAATFEIRDVLPFSIARLKKYLDENALRPDEIRRRAFPVEPDEIRKLIGKMSGTAVTLLFTTVAGQRTVIVANRIGHLTNEQRPSAGGAA